MLYILIPIILITLALAMTMEIRFIKAGKRKQAMMIAGGYTVVLLGIMMFLMSIAQ